jgi:heat shock protein HslJ
MAGYTRATLFCAALACIATGAACRSRDSREPPPGLSTVTLDGTQWLVSSLNGRTIIEGSNITMNFTADALGGYAGCNWYGARYASTANSIAIGAPEGTLRGCQTPAGVGQQEQTYYETLQRVAAYRVVDNRMEMMNASNEVVLVLIPRARFAMNPADLIGTRWRLRSVNDTMRASDSLLTLHLTATEISGFAGCRAYTGTYQAQRDEIHVTSLSMAATECHKGDAALLREGEFTTDLSEASHYRLNRDSLELVTAPGRRLLFLMRR